MTLVTEKGTSSYAGRSIMGANRLDANCSNQAKMLCLPAALLALALLIPTGAFSQSAPTANYTSFEATSAKPVQIGYYATARKDCAPAPAPTIRVIEAPKSGTLTIRSGVLTTSTVAGCPNLKTPAQIVFYQARSGTVGTDHLVYAVVGLDGKVNGFDVTITIRDSPKAPISSQDNPI